MFRKLRAEAERENGKENKLMFDNRALFALLLPIIIEQILNSFMGMVDTVMVSNVGSAAISAVSLVDSINNLVLGNGGVGCHCLLKIYRGERQERL